MFTDKYIINMRFSRKNLGLVQDAEIELNGLTVLTGYNDCGKSFIGKMVYAIIKTIKNAVKHNNDSNIDVIFYNISRISASLQKAVPNAFSDTSQTNGYVFNEALAKLSNRLEENGLVDTESLRELISKFYQAALLCLSFYDKDKSRIAQADYLKFQEELERNFKTIDSIINFTHDEETLYKNYFQDIIINKMFNGKINSFSASGSTLEVKVTEGSETLINISIENNTIVYFRYKATETPIFKTDIILIETPTIITLDKFFFRNLASSFRERFLPINYLDLLEKLYLNDPSPTIGMDETIKDIAEIIGGNISFDEKMGGMKFSKGENEIHSVNVATGIKSFGIIQTLLMNGHLNPDVVLIIDEPEVHLHPAWEVAYAKIILNLMKQGVLILISTHSSYILSALDKYSKDMGLEDKVNYYYGKKDTDRNSSNFKKFELSENPIWKTMSKPMRDLM